MSDRCCFNRWQAARTEENTARTLVFVATESGHFQTWGEDAREALRVLGGGQQVNVGGVAFLSIAQRHWQKDRDQLLSARYTVRVVG